MSTSRCGRPASSPRCRARGIRWVFISNADNLGATCDPDLAAWVMTNEVPYLAEVCERTPTTARAGTSRSASRTGASCCATAR